jgi:hypothetical protein
MDDRNKEKRRGERTTNGWLTDEEEERRCPLGMDIIQTGVTGWGMDGECGCMKNSC